MYDDDEFNLEYIILTVVVYVLLVYNYPIVIWLIVATDDLVIMQKQKILNISFALKPLNHVKHFLLV